MNHIRPALSLFLLFTVLLGGIYPAIVTGLAGLIFPRQATGSLIPGKDGAIVGSALIGQPFSDPKYFWPRPSATSDFPYNPLASGGANLGPTNPKLRRQVEIRLETLHAAGIEGPIPADLVLASASGLDPHISPEAALAQIPRVAKLRGLSAERLRMIVGEHTEDRYWGVLGEPRVNVLALNLALDTLKQ